MSKFLDNSNFINKRTGSSINLFSYSCSITMDCKQLGKSPTKSFLVCELLSSCKRSDSPSIQRKAIQRRMLRHIIESYNNHSENAFMSTLYCAIFSLIYHAALRCSEVCQMLSTSHTINFEDISWVGPKSQFLKISMRSYKHSDSIPLPIKLGPPGDATCPTALYKKYASLRG